MITSTGRVHVSFNEQDIADAIQAGLVAAIENALRKKANEVMEQVKQPPPRVLNLQPFAGTLNIRSVRVVSTAPIGACLWRRNLDGGNWRKRGHVAHRRSEA